MKPEESFVGQPVRSLQTMLRTIDQVHPRQHILIPDGIYGPQTVEAVSAFQRREGLPANGVADQATWERIAERYEDARIETEPAQPIQITLNPGQVIRRNEEHHLMYLIQSMLILLSELYEGFPAPEHTGILDWPTQQALTAFQIYSNLPPTGELDKKTWKALALQFSQAADQIDNLTEANS